jgi:hypothetical protein
LASSLRSVAGACDGAAATGGGGAGCGAAETHRVLRPGGRYVVISYSEPEDRLPALQSPQFKWMLVEQKTLRKNKAEFYTYVLQKPPA